MLFVSSRLSVLSVLVLLEWLLLSSVCVVDVAAQTDCTAPVAGTLAVNPVFSDGLLTGFAHLFQVSTGALPNDQTTVNTLAVNVASASNPSTVTLALYTYNSQTGIYTEVAVAQPLPLPSGASGVYNAQLPSSYVLLSNTQYYIGFYSSVDTVRVYAFTSSAPDPGFTSPGGLRGSYSGNPTFSTTGQESVAIRTCTYPPASGNGDPLFTGFLGQQFYIAGQDGGVVTVISSAVMQLNARLVSIAEGQSILPYEQDKLREASELLVSADPFASPALPLTTAWTHPGTYFGEAAVVLLDDNRVYARTGAYEHGWAAVTLNQRPLPVSDVPVVIGQGANTTYIHRVSDHVLTVRTHTLQLTLVNSDHFLNIERVQLEKGYKPSMRLGGILGGTANSSWTWHPKVEFDNTVASNDLFDAQQMDS